MTLRELPKSFQLWIHSGMVFAPQLCDDDLRAVLYEVVVSAVHQVVPAKHSQVLHEGDGLGEKDVAGALVSDATAMHHVSDVQFEGYLQRIVHTGVDNGLEDGVLEPLDVHLQEVWVAFDPRQLIKREPVQKLLSVDDFVFIA